MAINLGGSVRLTYTVRDANGAPANPATRTLTITQPDGTTASPEVPAPAQTGQLVVDFAPTQPGLHQVRWATTGPATADDDVFTVEPPGVQLVGVDEAVAHLRAQGTIDSAPDREQLQWLCLVASAAIESDLGRTLVRRTFTEAYAWRSPIVLKHSPVLTVMSVQVGGLIIDPAYYSLNGPMLTVTGYGGTLTVTYVAGYPVPPYAARMVALATVQSLWQSSQQASHPFFDESAPEQAVGTAVMGLPDAVRGAYEALRLPGIA